MIFLAVSTFGFDRLVKKMDEIAGSIDEQVVMQIGRGKYVPRNAEWFDFVNEEEFRQWCRKARIVVTHGAMTMIDALEQGTPVIVVPRLKKYGEVIDDHQLYLVKELESEGKIAAIYDVEGLERTLKTMSDRPVGLVKDSRLVSAIKGHIAEWQKTF